MNQEWEVKRLGDICDLQNGFAFKSKDYINFSNTMNFRMSQIRPGGEIDLEKNPKYLPDDYALKYQDYILNEGDVVIAMTDLATETKILGVPTIIPKDTRAWLQNQRVGKFFNIDLSRVHLEFLKYILSSNTINEYYKRLGRGGLQINIGKQDILNAQIPLPPLPEQKRIVAILDKAFTAIAKAKANAEQNLKNTKELFESYLQGVFENKDKRWEEIKLSDLATDITDGDHMPPPKTESGIPFITISNINKKNYEINFLNTFFVPIEYFQKIKENRKPKKGDILYTVTGSYGIPVLIEFNFEFCFQRHISLIRPKENVNSKWLFYWILSPQALRQANETATGTAQKTVSLKALRNFILPNFSTNKQQTIIRELDSLSAETKKLEAVYQQKIKDLEELKKSVLQKAFNGEL